MGTMNYTHRMETTLLEGGSGADFFDCGAGFDTVVDFNPNEGDITNDNCEDVRTNL